MDGTGDAHAGHAGHDHSAHAAMGAVERLPDGGYRYTHGAWLGHMLPAGFFFAWGAWWCLCLFSTYVGCLASKRPFVTRGWWGLPCSPARLRGLPLEPLVKVALPLVGILGELWLGHDSFRVLYLEDGHFTDHLNDWQHAAMYTCFVVSGVVDLLGHALGLPQGAELAFLALSFLGEGLLLVFHLKGPQVEILVHLILALQVFATVVAILGELACPHSLLAAAARPWLTMLQGAWWAMTAHIMYTNQPQWDPDNMKSSMFVPVPFVLSAVGVAFGMLLVLLVIKFIAERRLGHALSFGGGGEGEQGRPHHFRHSRLPSDEEPAQRDVELSGLIKTYAPHGV